MVSTSINPGTLAVIILTFNEEDNIPRVLKSVSNWSSEIFVLDSFSTDGTVKIAKSFGCKVVQNKFENFAKQRNFALDELRITSEWVLFLDADEWIPDDLKNEIVACISSDPVENGYYINRRFIWMGKWVRRGYYPIWTLRLVRHKLARCEDRAVNEHLIVQGETGYLESPYVHEDQKSIADWIIKHVDRARREAVELLNTRSSKGYQEIEVRFFGAQAQRKRWLRYKIWNKLPPLIRPFFYFTYRYFFLGGFLDGRNAFIYHFLQALWLPMLIDIFYLEFLFIEKMRREKKTPEGLV